MEKEGLKKGIELYTRVNNLFSRPGLKEEIRQSKRENCGDNWS